MRPRQRRKGVVHGRKLHGKAIICSPIAAKTSQVAAIFVSASARQAAAEQLADDQTDQRDV